MREIKFRAWDRLQKRMFSGDEILGPKPSIEVVPTIPSNYRLNEYFVSLSLFALEWMQFTGLKDKNETHEIYEGDKIKTPAGVGVVEWYGGCYHICWDKKNSTTLHDTPQEMMEVIGNVWE